MLIPQNLLKPHTAQPYIFHMPNFFDPACLEYINHIMDTGKWEYAWVGDAKKTGATETRNTKNIIVAHHNDSDYLYQTIMRKFVEVNNKCLPVVGFFWVRAKESFPIYSYTFRRVWASKLAKMTHIHS